MITQWLEWAEVCGKFDDDVFLDGKGMFGFEHEDLGVEQPLYNSFRNMISNKEQSSEVKLNKGIDEQDNVEVEDETEDNKTRTEISGKGESSDKQEDERETLEENYRKEAEATEKLQDSIHENPLTKIPGYVSVRLDDALEAQPYPAL
jgi:hypothetical protein